MYVCLHIVLILISYYPRPDLKMLVVSISSHIKLYMLMATAKLQSLISGCKCNITPLVDAYTSMYLM